MFPDNDLTDHAFTIVIFGGSDKDLTFRQTITQLKVTIDTKLNTMQLNDIDASNFEQNIHVSETLIEPKGSSIENSNLNNTQCYDFGYQSFINGKTNDKFIIVIGGNNNSSNIIVWNYTKDEFTFLNNV